MTGFNHKKTILCFSLISLLFGLFAGPAVSAQTVNVDASKLLAHVDLSFSPRSGSFVVDSTFQVPIYINTRSRSINGIELRINFDKNKLSIVNPTGGTSIIGVWAEPPKFDNTRGTASYVGVVPNGITTEAGLIGTITFKAKAPGNAAVSIATSSRVLLNDGLGTETQVDFGRANYTIMAKAPEGVQIFSETHPIQTDWYNNNTPAVSWVGEEGITGFSYVLDNKPNTIPDNIIDTEQTAASFETIQDGLWYFHIKALKNNIWGTTGNFLIHIDTAPPAEFTPEVNYLVAAVVETQRTLVSFFTTDNLSGVDHYEVGIIDKNQPPTESPLFEQAESPIQVPLHSGGKLQVIVRAIDKAGNVRDESVDVRTPLAASKFWKEYQLHILFGIIGLAFLMFILHYLVGHHILRSLRRAREILRKENIELERKSLLYTNTEAVPKPPSPPDIEISVPSIPPNRDPKDTMML